jgi:hypothetical protein
MNNRNQRRVLSEEQIKDITEQVATDLVKYKIESAESLVSHYLMGDADGLLELISNWVELAEDEVLNRINTQLNEDSFKQTDQDDYDN